MLQANLSKAFKEANELAIQRAHEYIGVEHVLYILTFSESFIQKLSNFGISQPQMLQNDINNVLDEFPRLITPKTPIATYKLGEIFKKARTKESFGEDEFLNEILNDKDSTAYEILKFHGFTEKNELEEFLLNLNELAKKNKLDPVIDRDSEIEAALQTLCRHKKNNPIFVGEAGVGKTAIVHAIVQKIVEGDVPDRLKECVIYSLDLASVLAGAKYKGEFEDRLKSIIQKVQKEKQAIIFIDEIHSIVDINGSGENGVGMSSILKPYLANGSLRCIGATTYSEFRIFNKDKALLRRFHKINVNEPDEKSCFLILKGLKKIYENFHNVTYSDEILKLCVHLSKRYLNDKFLPDSAIDLMDEAGAKLSMKNSLKKPITKALIQETISKMSNISNLNITNDNTKILKNLKQILTQKIYGQDSAIDALNDALTCSYAGLNEPNRPIGVFLFTGSSGVGKSELAIELAKALSVNFERYDMSEYMEKHAVSKLIGSPPGYVGFENGGLLTNAIKNNPYSVILFDEIEKANEELVNIFLQIFDSASLTDATGNKSDFKNTIIIMTSNLGTKEANTMGFTKDESNKTDKAVKGFFASEFRNRLDKVINFKDLDKGVLEKIVQKEISSIENLAKNIKINLSKRAIDELIRLGYSSEFGARNLKRVIKEKINNPLSKELLYGRLKSGGEITFDEEFNFEVGK